MLAWVNTQLAPKMSVKNFTVDWNNGLAICRLVERVRPGLIPDWGSLRPTDGLKNCRLAMTLAEEKLDIPKILEPEDLSHADVDEISVMTYISYFCNPINTHLLNWVQQTIPHRNIKNFKTDWNDGVSLAHLLEALNPGGFADCSKLDPQKAVENLARAMKAADDQLGIKPILKPDQMADPKVDELNVATYLSRFQNAKPLPQPQAVVCSGEGLRKAMVGRQAVFEVDTSKGGSGELVVEITRKSGGKPISPKISPTSGKKAVLTVSYTTDMAGDLSIAVKWSGSQIPSSPYLVHVLDPKSITLTGPQITGGECAKVGQLVKMEASGVSEITDFEVMVEFSNGQKEEAKIVAVGKGAVQCSYAARVVGKDKITAKIGGVAIKGSPFTVKVFDPKLFSVTLRDPPPGKPLSINSKATLVVSSSQGAVEGAVACLVSSTGSQEITLRTQGDGSALGVVTPVSVGKQEIQVTCGGDAIKGSPIILQVFDSSKCRLEDIPGYLHVNQSHSIGLSLKGAGEGTAEAKSSDSRVLAVECQPEGKDKYAIKLTPKVVGECSVSVEWNGMAVGQSPKKVSIIDATKVTAYGPGLTSGQGKVGQLFVFTVQAKGAGSGKLSVVAKGPKKTYPVDISKNPDGTYKVSFTTSENGRHTVEVLWSGKGIPTSPHVVEFKKPVNAKEFTATGDGLKTAVALSVAKFAITGPEPDLLSSKTLDISLSSGGIKSTLVTDKSAFDLASKKAIVFASDTGEGTYSVNYSTPSAGKYSLAVTSEGENIPGSPFSVEVLPAPDAGKCRAFGHALDNPNSLIVLKPLEFKVETTNAGAGVLAVTCKNPQGNTVPVFLAEDKSNPKQKVHSVKIEPSVKGKFEVSVQWSEMDIPKSPIVFDVGNPKDVIIIDLADSADFVGRKGEVMSFSVDARKAGPGEVKAAAKYDDGKLVLYEQKKNKDGTLKLTHTPAKEGRMELLLTYSEVNILPLPWVVDVIDPAAFKVIMPKESGRLNENVKFVLVGVQKKQAKNISITAKNKSHDATVKMEFSDKAQATASFIPKEIGEYTVEVKVASKDIPGSPFKCSIVDPSKCIVDGDIPKVIMIGSEKKFKVDTTKAGPGELTVECLNDDGTPSTCLENSVSAGSVRMAGKACGKSTFVLKFAGFPITSKATEVFVTDPSKCTYSCKGIVNGCCKTNTDIVVDVDCSHGGNYPPMVEAKGPKSKYDIEVKRVTEGHYNATFAPTQEGSNKIDILIEGIKIPGSPMSFKSEQPLDAGKVRVEGPGLKGGVANRRSEITIYAQESMLVEKGLLKVSIEGEARKTLNIVDKKNGTYEVSYVPSAKRMMTLSVTGDGINVPGSPFSIIVAPEPNASKCKLLNRSGDEVFSNISSMYCKVRTPFEVGVATSGAGSGSVSASGTAPNKSPIHVITKEEKDVTYVKFEPNSIGVHTLSIAWDKESLQGSPYSIKVVDPSKCVFTDPFPSSVKVGDKAVLRVNTSAMGEGELEAFSSGSSVKVSTVMKKAGMYELTIIGVSLGSATIDIKFGGFSVKGSPYALNTCDPSKCTSDFKTGVLSLGVPFKFRVKTDGAGKADLRVVSSKKGTHQVKNIKSSTWEVTFTAREMGEYILNVLWGEWDVAGSPFTFSVCDPSKVKINGLRDPKGTIQMGEAVSFNVNRALAGPGKLSCYTICNGKREELTWDETGGNSDDISVKFTPATSGKFQLYMEYNGVDILMKPYIYEVLDPMQLKVTTSTSSRKLEASSITTSSYESFKSATVSTMTYIMINAIESGLLERGLLVARLVKDELDYPFDVTDKGDGMYEFRFIPLQEGTYYLNITYKGKHIQGSPFKSVVGLGAAISDKQKGLSRAIEKKPKTIEKKSKGIEKKTGLSILGLNLKGDYGIVHEPVTIKISGEKSEEVPLLVTAHGPSADLHMETVQDADKLYSATFVPSVPGSYEVFVEYAGRHVSGSPMSVKVADPSKCQLLGGALSTLQVGDTGEMIVKTRGAGEGELKAFVNTTSILDCVVKDQGLDTYMVCLTGKAIGKATVDLQWAGFTIPSNPYLVNVCDARKCRAYGMVFDSRKAKAGVPIKFTVETRRAGEASLKVTANGPTAQYTVDIEDLGETKYEVSFTPWEIGGHKINIFWGTEHVPESPLDVNVGSPLEMETCSATGDGLKRGIARQKATFTVICSEMGLLNTNVLKINVTGTKEHIDVNMRDLNNGCYTVEYTPPIPGAYVASVMFHGKHITGSPFKIAVDSGPDASKCKAYGPALHPNTLAIAGSPLEFFVDTVEAGFGELRVLVQGANDYSPRVFLADDEKGIHSVKFDAMKPGKYKINVLWSEEHIPKSPFRLRVHPAADASKVKASGPGLSDSAVGSSGLFHVETKQAGIGSLLVRVHGLKNSFKIEASPLSKEEPRTMVINYNPKLAAEYTVFVRWSGVHIPGSPFTVAIDKPGEAIKTRISHVTYHMTHISVLSRFRGKRMHAHVLFE